MLEKFYHSTIKKAVISFGNLFNNLYVDRKNADGEVVQTVKVPLSYAPRQKFIARIEAIPETEVRRDFQVILPRMGFEMLQIQYDPQRRVSYVQQSRNITADRSIANSQYAPSPYNIIMSLYIYAKNQDDGLQILEQILPYFNPDFNLSITAIPELEIQNDLPIVLDDISYDDQYEGDFQSRRSIIWTLNFTVKLNFYGPITKKGLINFAKVNFFNDEDLQQRIQKYSVQPGAGQTQGNVTSFLETFEDF